MTPVPFCNGEYAYDPETGCVKLDDGRFLRPWGKNVFKYWGACFCRDALALCTEVRVDELSPRNGKDMTYLSLCLNFSPRRALYTVECEVLTEPGNAEC